MCAYTLGAQKLELELQVVMSYPKWVLGQVFWKSSLLPQSLSPLLKPSSFHTQKCPSPSPFCKEVYSSKIIFYKVRLILKRSQSVNINISKYTTILKKDFMLFRDMLKSAITLCLGRYRKKCIRKDFSNHIRIQFPAYKLVLDYISI